MAIEKRSVYAGFKPFSGCNPHRCCVVKFGELPGLHGNSRKAYLSGKQFIVGGQQGLVHGAALHIATQGIQTEETLAAIE